MDRHSCRTALIRITNERLDGRCNPRFVAGERRGERAEFDDEPTRFDCGDGSTNMRAGSTLDEWLDGELCSQHDLSVRVENEGSTTSGVSADP